MLKDLETLIYRQDLTKIEQYLDENELDLTQKNASGNTPLHLACRVADQGNCDLVKLLLQHPCDINSKGVDDYTPLAYAVSSQNKELVEILIERGAEINSVCVHGNTIISDAVMSFCGRPTQKEIIEILLSSGADPTIKNRYGHSALDLLSMPKNEEITACFSAQS